MLLRKRVRLPSLLLGLLACAQGAAGSAGAAGAVVPLEGAVLFEALPLVREQNYQGMAVEADTVAAWAMGRTRVGIAQDGESFHLIDESGSTLPLSAPMGRVLVRLNEYYGMRPRTEAHPVSSAELDSAVLSKQGIATIQGIFEDAIAAGLWLKGRLLVMEVGGEATLDGELELRTIPDTSREILREIAELPDPESVGALCARHPIDMEIVDSTHMLRNFVALVPVLRQRGVPESELARQFRETIAGVVLNGASRFTLEPAAQFAAIVSSPWSGRYLGRWHTHPPHDTGEGWAGSGEPSFDDLEEAMTADLIVTISFQPDGFDFYDASRIKDEQKPDLQLVRVVRYRSPGWKLRFDALKSQLKPGAGSGRAADGLSRSSHGGGDRHRFPDTQ
jgi:hypothetical protein